MTLIIPDIKINKYWLSYFIVKLFYMFFAILVYSKITTLGDTDRYINGNLSHSAFAMISNSTSLMDMLGGMSSLIFGTVLSNVPFLILSFYGVYYSVSRLKLTKKQLFLVLFLLSFPSFSIWTSIVSKEAMGVFFMGVILGYLIDLMDDKNRKIKFIEYLAIYLLLIFKPQYFIAIFSLWSFIKISFLLNLQANGKSILFLFHVVVVVVAFYYFREMINDLSFIMPAHFSLSSGSTRENTIWVNDYDVFYNAPYGMFIGFFGPTLSEVLQKPIQGIAFIESIIILSFFSFFLIRIVLKVINTSKINVFLIAMLLMSLFWLLFVHYPFGVLNPGSAIRYRENFYGFLVVFLFYLYTRYIQSNSV
ncbi:MAG: hypothetical protein PHU40_11335 [Sulfurimonas sp.]|nr:hypothetical protein [Sulfurimonas sp.]